MIVTGYLFYFILFFIADQQTLENCYIIFWVKYVFGSYKYINFSF